MSENNSHPRESSELFPSKTELMQSLQNDWTKELLDLGLGDVLEPLALDLVEQNGVVKIPTPFFEWDLKDADRGISQEELNRLMGKYLRFLDDHHISSAAGIPVSSAGKEYMLRQWSELMVSGEDGPCKAMAKALKNIGVTDQELEDAAVQFIPPVNVQELKEEGITSEEIIESLRFNVRRVLGLPF